MSAGLSPRGRGKLATPATPKSPKRSIPAWAGETFRGQFANPAVEVYPRVGGGNWIRSSAAAQPRGLSPRGRGKLGGKPKVIVRRRSIPAWAGETGIDAIGFDVNGVYPRVGGGNALPIIFHKSIGGLSPRGRGKHRLDAPSVPKARSIPAWAGETKLLAVFVHLAKVYPRVGGGNQRRQTPHATTRGLSPRGRGKHLNSRLVNWWQGSIPAWAGETHPKSRLPAQR